MLKAFTVFLLASIGLMSGGCEGPQWVVQSDVTFTEVGNVGNKCHENEERVRKSISPVAITTGSFRVDIEACVQKDAITVYLDSTEKLQDQILSVDPVSKRIYADQVEKLVRARMKEAGKDKNGEDVPRAFRITLYQWTTY